MKLHSDRRMSFPSVITTRVAKMIPGFCLALVFTAGIAADAFAADDERLGAYSLSDQGMLGRYGDVNDEWVSNASVGVASTKMTEQAQHKAPKKDNRMGAYSMEDDAMLGRYGDKDDGY